MDLSYVVNNESVKEALKQKRAKLHCNRWGSIAAILLVLIFGACAVPAVEPTNASLEESVAFESSEPTNLENSASTGDHYVLPMLSAMYDAGDTGMGSEGTMSFDISEFDDGNPWTKDTQLHTLPVFKNLSYTSDLIPVYLDKDEQRIMAESAAKAMGLKILNFTYETISSPQEDSPFTGDEISRLTAITDKTKINVEGNGHLSVWFNKPLKLPAGFNFTSENTSNEEARQILDYLSEQFSGLTQFIQPEKITWVTYSFNGDQTRYYQLYDGSGDITQKILNYNFNSVFFTPSNHGLWVINVNNLLKAAEMIGDYPIITWEQARDLLLDGHYITSIPKEELPTSDIKQDLIANVELIYRVHDRGEYFMPYYRFAVKINRVDNMAEGLTNYGFFYVPAVSGEYLTDFPVWDGTMNR